jgi:hypothetical protein
MTSINEIPTMPGRLALPLLMISLGNCPPRRSIAAIIKIGRIYSTKGGNNCLSINRNYLW